MTSTHSTKVLAFGPQSLSFDHQASIRLHSHLISNPRMSWARDVLEDLHTVWCRVVSAIPSLQHVEGEMLLRSVTTWIQTGEARGLTWPMPNIILTPLTVALHLSDLEEWKKDKSQTQRTISHGGYQVLGLCTGLLSASAVSFSSDDDEIHLHGAVALRLAMLIGAVVDAKDLSLNEMDRAVSFVVHWSNTGTFNALDNILEEDPTAYISVIQDSRKATVTTARNAANQLLDKLQRAGFSAVEIPLRGYFHWEGHSKTLVALTDFCDSNSDFYLQGSSGTSQLVKPYETGSHVNTCDLHHWIVRSILLNQSNWNEAFSRLQKCTGKLEIESFGSERFVPSHLGHTLSTWNSTQNVHCQVNGGVNSPDALQTSGIKPSLGEVAVIGMACHLPGAADIGEFWDLLCAGNSQHVEVPSDRVDFTTPWRQAGERKWFGNFVDDYDTFDNRFFKKSSREAASTDPQQRLMLQVAYQAVEQAGYLKRIHEKAIGCYISIGSDDYQENIAHHPANAYSATGNLKAFAAGRISHYFGWNGPGLTIDSACSSSAVAIHLACQGILSGDCNVALVGGVNLISGPDWYHNLAGASFLSPTGQCKPFDASADGYCRGEAVGAVVLKRLSAALEDGDQIFGIIAGSAVQQNRNNTAITVPNELSLSDLFRRVTHKAGISPVDVTYVEAHGTGTAIGDPTEYESIRRVFGGSARTERNRLAVGSVKGLLGHAEAASGIVALLKILTMLHHRTIPPQASFQRASPALCVRTTDHMDIYKDIRPWYAPFRAALINNYGASGSNSSFLVIQPPESISKSGFSSSAVPIEDGQWYPFAFYAPDEGGLRRYTSKLLKFVRSNKGLALSDISSQNARHSNTALRCSLSFSCSSTSQLQKSLETWSSTAVTVTRPPRPVILCFGGQKSAFVGLDRQIYNTTKIFRTHLDRCNAVCEGLGTTIFPTIFQRTPIPDIVKLHTALFSLQYACGRSWIDCMPGFEVGAVVGHSIGELTALCISGAASLESMLKYVVGRAKLIRDAWGPDKGSMLAVEAGLDEVRSLMAESAKRCPDEDAVSIACFNGQHNFTLAGSTKAIDTVLEVATHAGASFKIRRLNVTNAYHCSLANPLLPSLRVLAQSVEFHTPLIHIEIATENSPEGELEIDLLVKQFRQSVFFSHAVQRLAKRLPSAVWIEAGSDSGVTLMANRALEGLPEFDTSAHHFQALNITGGPPIQRLAEATVSLWREGVNVSFWPHHSSQVQEYSRIILPPYQFEKERHWVERKKPDHIATSPSPLVAPDSLWSFVSYQDNQKRSVRFQVNTNSKQFHSILESHVIAQEHPLCPSILQLEIVIDALMSLEDGFCNKTCQPQLLGMASHSPMLLNRSRTALLDAHATKADCSVWAWSISSTATDQSTTRDTITHVTGEIAFRRISSPEAVSEFSKFQRLVRRERCLSLLDDTEVDDAIQGQRNIYRVFSDVVAYGDMFQGLRKIVGKGGQESAGRVVRVVPQQSWLDFTMADCFCQVAGIFVNSFTERQSDEMYISDGIDQYIRSPHISSSKQRPNKFEVYACHDRSSDKEFLSDVFVFDSAGGALVEVIIGIHYRKISKAAFSRMLKASGMTCSELAPTATFDQPRIADINGSNFSVSMTNSEFHEEAPWQKCVPVQKDRELATATAQSDISSQLKEIIASLSGLDVSSIEDASELNGLGIDSLMGMELSREIENTFKCAAHATLALDLPDFQSLVAWVNEALGMSKHRRQPSTGGGTSLPKVTRSSPQTTQNEDITFQNGLARPLDNREQFRPSEIILQTFSECCQSTDEYIKDNELAGYVDNVLPQSDALCIALICDAFEQLGCPIRTAVPGQKLAHLKCLPKNERFVTLLWEMLESRADLITSNELGERIRTAVPAPNIPAEELLHALNDQAPAHIFDHNLTALAGTRLVDCIVGDTDCVQLMFGSPEARETVSAMYSQSPINTVWITQMVDVVKNVILQLPESEHTINILELGAGTGGTTSKMVSLLANLQSRKRFTYTVTDISSSLVASAKRRFKQYPFVNCRVLDIEEEAPVENLQNYDIVLATNCVHATRSLANSTKNIRQMLRPNGFLLMLEMTEPLAWVDLVFGLVEGWWLFEDGRTHALACPELWEETLHSSGYGRVEWTSGMLPESRIQRLILAMTNGSGNDIGRQSSSATLSTTNSVQTGGSTLQARRKAVEYYVEQYTSDFALVVTKSLGLISCNDFPVDDKAPVVLVTGASGSLGSHLLKYLSSLSQVGMVICLNRPSSLAAQSRQEHSLSSKNIMVDAQEISKWRVFQTDTHKPLLGLSLTDYRFLACNITHIIHNAWPMSIRRPIHDFELQFKAMRNLIDLARDAHICQGTKIGFQFVSSIAVVGAQPLHTGQSYVKEEAVTVESVLPNGYGEAKLVCEKILSETLQRFPDAFGPSMTVRIGQIAGARTTGYWNPVEHFAFMMKSSQTLGCLPDLRGSLSWCPVDDVAEALGELLLSPGQMHATYHIENPVRQEWEQMIRWLATALDVSTVVPYSEWLKRVCQGESSLPTDQQMSNPAARLTEFLGKHFERMSCGGLVLSTEKSRAGSTALRHVGPVDENLVRGFVRSWKKTGLLSN